MNWYFRGCCGAPVTTATTPAPTPTPTPYSYSVGPLQDVPGGGSAVNTSATQTMSLGAVTSVTFGTHDVDDLAAMIPVGASVTATYNSGTTTTTATLPTTAIILASTGLSTYSTRTIVTDGTHTATIAAGTSASGATAALTTAGFTVVSGGGPILLSDLHAKGMADTSGNMSWLWALVPSGSGLINVGAVTTA